MATMSDQVRALTYDPGARLLAQAMDSLIAQVNACCGHSASVKAANAGEKVPVAASISGAALPSEAPATDSK